MSWKATGYVKELRRCEDGAELSRGQKLLLFVLADSHDPHRKEAWPSIATMADEALTSLSQVKRDLAYLEEHCVIEKVRPDKSGRTHFLSYVFLALDAPERLEAKLSDKAKGGHGEPLSLSKGVHARTPFCPDERGSKGVHGEHERGSKGVHGAQRNKEEPKSQIRTEEQAQSADPSVRAQALKAKRPEAVREFGRTLERIYQANVGSREAFSDDPFVVWSRDVRIAKQASERCRLPVEIGLALCGLSDRQILLLTRRARSPDEQEANLRAAFEVGQGKEAASA